MKNSSQKRKFASENPATSDSEDYSHTFYGILNKQGDFWSPMPFTDESSARSYLRKWAVGKCADMLETHKVVPVRIQLTAIAIEARQGGNAAGGSVHESAAIAQGPQS